LKFGQLSATEKLSNINTDIPALPTTSTPHFTRTPLTTSVKSTIPESSKAEVRLTSRTEVTLPKSKVSDTKLTEDPTPVEGDRTILSSPQYQDPTPVEGDRTILSSPPIPKMAAKVRKRIPSIPSYSDVNRSTGSLQIPNVVSIPNMQNPQKSEPAFDVLGTDSPGILRKTRIREVAPEARSSRKKVSHSLSTSEVPAELFSGMIVLQSVPPQSLAALLQPALYKSSRRAEIVCLAHNDYMGHHGCRATTRMLRAYGYTWVGMHKDVEDFVKRCVTCQLNNYNTHPFKGKRYLLVASHPFERVTIDALGRLEGDDSYSYMVVKYVTCPGSSGYLRSSL
jgi:Integrase zinc binding domain